MNTASSSETTRAPWRQLWLLILPLLLAGVAVLGWLGYQNLSASAEAARWEAHTQVVIDALDNLLSDLKDAETGQRGFIITGDPSFLEPYQEATRQIDARLRSLEDLTKDNPRQQARLHGLEPVIRRKLDELAQTVALRSTTGFQAAAQAVATGQGAQLMNALRRDVAAARADEAQLLQGRSAERDASARRALRTLMAGTGICLGLVLVGFVLLRRGILQRLNPDLASSLSLLTSPGAGNPRKLRYVVALALVAVAAGVREGLLGSFGGRAPYVTFYPAVIFAALYGGLRAGLLATALSALLVDFFWIAPLGSLRMADPADWLAMGIFLLSGMTISAIAGAMHQSQARAADAEARATVAAERQRDAEALVVSQRQNELLAGIIEHSSQPFAVGYPDGRLGLFNHAYAQLTGYTADELRATNWAATLTPPEWREPEKQKLDELNRTGQPVRYEKEYLRKDGTRVSLELLVHLARDARGQPDYYYSFLTDITERKRADTALRATNAELARFNRLMVGREVRMVELKREVNELCGQLGQPPRYSPNLATEEPK